MSANTRLGQPVSPHIAAAPRTAQGSVTAGVSLMIAFALLAPGIDVFAKLAAANQPPGQVAFARFVVQFALLAPFFLNRRLLQGMTAARLALHFLRGLLIGLATVSFITALRAMPIADAIAIFFVEPMILTLLGAWILGEPVHWRRYLACAIGFLGALIVIQPSFQALGPVALLPLATAFSFALYLMLTRKMAHQEDPFAMQGFAGLFGGLCVGAALIVGQGSGSPVFDPTPPDLTGWWLLGAVGVLATISHLLIVFAFRNAQASVLAPIQYLEIVSATLLGYLVFSDFPDGSKWLGIFIIVGSGLFIFWRERQADREA